MSDVSERNVPQAANVLGIHSNIFTSACLLVLSTLLSRDTVKSANRP